MRGQTLPDRLPTHPFLVVREGKSYNIMNTETGKYRWERGKGVSQALADHLAVSWAGQHASDPFRTPSFFCHD